MKPRWAKAVAKTDASGAGAWRTPVCALSIGLALAGAWGSSTAQAAPQTHTVVIDNMRFTPDTLTVRRGDRVVWRNNDLVPHTATAAKVFDSGSIAPGQSWSTVVRKTGTLPYVCSFHPGMKATLQVQ